MCSASVSEQWTLCGWTLVAILRMNRRSPQQQPAHSACRCSMLCLDEGTANCGKSCGLRRTCFRVNLDSSSHLAAPNSIVDTSSAEGCCADQLNMLTVPLVPWGRRRWCCSNLPIPPVFACKLQTLRSLQLRLASCKSYTSDTDFGLEGGCIRQNCTLGQTRSPQQATRSQLMQTV